MSLTLNPINTGEFSLLTGPGSLNGGTVQPNTGTGYGTPDGGLARSLSIAAPVVAIIGVINSAVGAYYDAKSRQYQLKSNSLNLKFQADMAKLNARAAEVQAQTVQEAGHRQVGQYTMAAGQKKAGAMASMAARGIQAGVGSAQEVEASLDLVKEIDALTINANAVRSAEAIRMQGVNYSGQATMLGMSALNATTSANSINQYTAGTSSLIGGASNVALAWAARNNPYGFSAGMSF